jgi:hypothetical protein
MFTARSSGARLTDGFAGWIVVSFAMKSPLVIALAVAIVLGTGSALAAMGRPGGTCSALAMRRASSGGQTLSLTLA